MLTWSAPLLAAATVTVYSSLPLSGGSDVPHARAIVRGATLAQEEAGGKAGPHVIRYVSLSDGKRHGWTPGEPDKYYPTGESHYVRLAPTNYLQGGALAAAMRDRGCRRVAVVNDNEVFGAGVAVATRRAAHRLGLEVVLNERLGVDRDYRGLARRVRRAHARCVVYAGIAENGAAPLFRALGHVKRFAADGVATRAFMRRRIARRVLVTTYTLPPAALPPAGQDFFRRYTARWGDATPDPYAVYGYESMKLVLDAVAAVGRDRGAIIRWLHTAVRDRPSPFGPYSIDRFGDTSVRAFGLYRIRHRQLRYVDTITVP